MVFYHNLNPILFDFGILEIRWYGLMWVLGFLVTYFYVRAAARKKILPLSDKEVDDLIILLTVAVLIGARVFEVLFYRPSYYFSNPSQIIAIWRGGLSFHGGLLGITIAAWWYCKRKKISLLKLADVFVVPLALAQAFGRIGNFINGELYGRITSLPWGMKFPAAEGFRHPSQLYEFSYNLVIFGILYPLRNKKYREGTLLAWFLILYSVFRFLNEYVREPEVFIGPFTLGQVFNIPMFLFGLWLLKRKKFK